MEKKCVAIMNKEAFLLLSRVVEEAVYGGSLDRNSSVIKDLYLFLESTKCLMTNCVDFDLQEKINNCRL